MKTFKATPSAASFMESLRDIGYSLETAIADILDNSISAEATQIHIKLDLSASGHCISITDNGHGMSPTELMTAMKPGSRSPLESRSSGDLGRFGLGLKTASFSQCRKLTVVTRRNGKLSAAIWDIDYVAKKDDWILQLPEMSELDHIPHLDSLGDTGTLVVWEKLDRLEEATDSTKLSDHLYECLNIARKHLELIFHRYLDGEHPFRKVQIDINGVPLKGFDPFNSRHPATIIEREEVIKLHGVSIKVQPYVLPHFKKVSVADWEKYAGDAGYLKNQGFYVYRAGRLIIHGTWFRLAKQAELTKLSRVRVDMPNELDHLWKIDVKKASAQPPLIVRERLKEIIGRIGGASNRVFTARGKKQVDPQINSLWARRVDKGEITYEVDTEHPTVKAFAETLDSYQERVFFSMIKAIGEYFPVHALYQDVAGDAEKVVPHKADDDALKDLMKMTCEVYREQVPGITDDELLLLLQKTEPFRSSYEQVEELYRNMAMGVD